MKTVIYNIGTLAGILPADVRKLEGSQMNTVECIENAYLVIEDGVITEFGPSRGSRGGENNPSHDFVAGPTPCGQVGSTVFPPPYCHDRNTVDRCERWIRDAGFL
mgnify:CR=1 FL=1